MVSLWFVVEGWPAVCGALAWKGPLWCFSGGLSGCRARRLVLTVAPRPRAPRARSPPTAPAIPGRGNQNRGPRACCAPSTRARWLRRPRWSAAGHHGGGRRPADPTSCPPNACRRPGRDLRRMVSLVLVAPLRAAVLVQPPSRRWRRPRPNGATGLPPAPSWSGTRRTVPAVSPGRSPPNRPDRSPPTGDRPAFRVFHRAGHVRASLGVESGPRAQRVTMRAR